MSASSALQKAIIDAMRADATLSGMVGGRIYDIAPSGEAYPHVTLGASTFYAERRDCMVTRIETVQVDVWTRDQERRQPCKGHLQRSGSGIGHG